MTVIGIASVYQLFSLISDSRVVLIGIALVTAEKKPSTSHLKRDPAFGLIAWSYSSDMNLETHGFTMKDMIVVQCFTMNDMTILHDSSTVFYIFI